MSSSYFSSSLQSFVCKSPPPPGRKKLVESIDMHHIYIDVPGCTGNICIIFIDVPGCTGNNSKAEKQWSPADKAQEPKPQKNINL